MLEIMSDFSTQKNQAKNDKRKRDKQINDKEFIINNNKILITSSEAKKDKSNNFICSKNKKINKKILI